jgi:hypothetical protein
LLSGDPWWVLVATAASDAGPAARLELRAGVVSVAGAGCCGKLPSSVGTNIRLELFRVPASRKLRRGGYVEAPLKPMR